uniref:Uncharacterized protein n=1 Tax=Ursus maritimus TaxID=29073 RepID=A0A452VKS9_URSMA
MRRGELFLRMPLLILIFLGLAAACIPREGDVCTLSPSALPFCLRWAGSRGCSRQPPEVQPDDRTEEESEYRVLEITFLAGQAFSVHHSHRALPEKLSLATTTPKKPPTKRTSWNMLKCAYMMVTFLFVSYNRGDWVRRSCYLRGQGGGRGAGRPRGEREWRERRDCQASGGVGEKIPLCKQNRPCLPHSLSLSTTPLHPLPPSWSLDRSHSLLH